MPGLGKPGLATPGFAMLALEKRLEPQRVRWAVPAAGGCQHGGPSVCGNENWTLCRGAGLTRALRDVDVPGVLGRCQGVVLGRALSPFIVFFDNYRGRPLTRRAVGSIFFLAEGDTEL